MRIILLGAPGSGKSTQAKKLAKKYNVPHISTGDLLRIAVKNKTALGLKIQAVMEAGELVTDDIVLDIIEERLKEPDALYGFILDGFPRNIPQAEALDNMLNTVYQPLEKIVLINVDFDVLMKRLTGRRTCADCGQMYNVYSSAPILSEVCNDCGGKLIQRADDNEETMRHRFKIYNSQTEPLSAYYQQQGKNINIEGVDNIDTIFERLETLLDPLDNAPEAIVEKETVETETSAINTADAEATTSEVIDENVDVVKKKKLNKKKLQKKLNRKQKEKDKKKLKSKKKEKDKKKSSIKKKLKMKKKKGAKKKNSGKKKK